jgi:hypothetical protein
MTETQEGATIQGDAPYSAVDLVRSLARHVYEFRHMLADPVSVRITPGVEIPVVIELSCGAVEQVCAGLTTWYESLEEDSELWIRRSGDGGTIIVEALGSTVDGVRCQVMDVLRWVPGLFPSVAAGGRMRLGSLLLSGLAKARHEPDRDYPAARSCLLDPPPEAGAGQ